MLPGVGNSPPPTRAKTAMTDTPAALNAAHPFEKAGLGIAPFRCVGVRENRIKHPDGTTQPGGTCSYCGTGIAYECVIQDARGQRAVVGCDCVRKVYTGNDAWTKDRLLTEMERARKLQARERARAKRLALWEERAAKAQEQRDAEARSLGYTDHEARVAAEQIQAEKKAASVAQEAEVKYGWLLSVLDEQRGDFAASIAADLREGRALDAMSPRVIQICREIYAKATGGRRGSKAFEAAVEDFDSRLEP